MKLCRQKLDENEKNVPRKVEEENIERDRERTKMFNEIKWGRPDADSDCSCWWMTNHIIIGEPFESEDVRTFYLLPRNFLAKADFFDFLKCAQSEPHSTTAKRCGKNPNSQCQLNGMVLTTYQICCVQIQRSTTHFCIGK